MLELNLEQVKSVAGGDLPVNVSLTVPAADVSLVAQILGGVISGSMDAAAFGALISNNAAAFNGIPLGTITIGSYMITSIPQVAPAPVAPATGS